jgi:hypothetical protein
LHKEEVRMSNKMLNLVRDAKIGNPTAKEVLKVIADQANDDGTGVWSSIAYFSFCTERGRSTIKNALKYLRKEGFIKHVSFTKAKTHEWKINVATLRKAQRDWSISTQEDIDLEEEEGQEMTGSEMTDGGSGDDPSTVQSGPQTPSNPNKTQCPQCEKETKRFHAKYGKPLLCDACLDANSSTCERCGKDRVERTPLKQRTELCHNCGLIVDEVYQQMPIRSLKTRTFAQIGFEAAGKIVETVGNVEAEQIRWAKYLDHWKLNKWSLHNTAGILRCLDAFERRTVIEIEDTRGKPNATAPRQGAAIINRRPGLVKYDK